MARAKTAVIPKKRVIKRKKTALRPSVVAVYAGAFVAIVAVIAASYQTPEPTPTVASVEPVVSSQATQQTSVDDVVATTLAANIAETTNLPVANNVANLSVSLAAEREIAATSKTEGVAKQEIVQPTGSRRDVITYTTVQGDTVDALVAKYGVSKDTIKWANNLTSDVLDPGKEIIILPVDGVIYETKAGDTTQQLAEKYKSNEERIIAFNDLEISGLEAGKKIIIPGGQLPENERPGYVAPRSTASYGSYSSSSLASSQRNFMSGSVGNKYVYGYCTWYVYERRANMGRPVGSFWGNANTWAAAARSNGFSVNSAPAAGDVFQTSYGGGGYGHVGVIESVDYASGTVSYSDMNGLAGWNQIGYGTVSIAEAQSRWVFIH